MELTSPTYFAKVKVQTVQDYVLFCVQSVTNLFQRPFYLTDIVSQADSIGVGSLPIVVLTGFFTGAVLALQASNTLERFGSLSLVGQLVSTSMVRELGPVLTSLMVAGRNSSGMASELGSMMVTEQIDAMRALGTDPTKKLVTPRVVATVVMLFFLTIISDLLGLVGGAAGVLFGVVGSYLVGQTLRWPVQMSLESVVIAAVFSIAVGVFFGYYPARKASLLDPIEALRYE